MTKIKEQVIEIIQEIPDDKLIHILEIAKGLKILYGEELKKAALNESPCLW